jgi:type IV pilus assembly protein PilC
MDFSYTAVDDLGQRVRGTAAAKNEAELADLLRVRGQHLLSVRSTTGALSERRILDRVNRRDVIFFTSQLSTVLATGINIVDGLRDIEGRMEKPVVRTVVAGVRMGIESGLGLSASLARYPNVFNELYVTIVRAGEATGRADVALDDLVQHLEWQEDLRRRIREAALYPILVSVLLLVVVSVLVGVAIPRIMELYKNMALTLPMPLPTRLVMAVTDFVRFNWLPIGGGIAALVIFLRVQWQTSDGRARLQGWILRVPVVGELVRKVAFSRFAHYFASLHGAGLEVAPSLTLIERLFGNEYLSRKFHSAVQRVMAGESLSRAMAATAEFPSVVVQMIALGEQTGRMDRSLENVRRYYDKEVEQGVRQAIAVFGPVMLLMLALVFVTMAVSFYLPLFRMLRAIQSVPR